MKDTTPRPQVNVSRIPVGDGVAGMLVVVLSLLIFLIGIPALRYFLPATIVLGCAVALIIHLARHETPGKPWIAPGDKK